MRFSRTVFVAFVVMGLTGCTMGLSMSPPAKLDIAGIRQLPAKAGLVLSKELRETVHVKQTSPFDKISYPIGEQQASFSGKTCRSFSARLWRLNPGAPRRMSISSLNQPSSASVR